MSITNITIDDWDPLIVYANPGDWSTPNPQDNPSWFNASTQVTGSIWNQGVWCTVREHRVVYADLVFPNHRSDVSSDVSERYSGFPKFYWWALSVPTSA